MRGTIVSNSAIILILTLYGLHVAHAFKCGDTLMCPKPGATCLYSSIKNDADGGMCTCKSNCDCGNGMYCGTEGYTTGMCQCLNDKACGVGFECVTTKEKDITERTCKPKVQIPQ